MKRLCIVFILLALAASLSLGGCGGGQANGLERTAQDQAEPGSEKLPEQDGDDDIGATSAISWQAKDYSGQTLKMVDAEHWMFITNKVNWGYSFYMAMLEWQELTGATIELLPALDIPAVLAGLVANEGYDLIGSGAYYAMHNLYQYLDDEIPYFTNKYGAKIVSQLGMNRYLGRYIAISFPWNFAVTAIHYNPALLDRLGIERPSQMFLRGAWTFDAYWDLVCRVSQLDIDGDGEMDFIAVANTWPHFDQFITVYEENEDGTYTNVADTQRLRDLAEMIYTGFNILDIYQQQKPEPWQGYAYSGERYPWISTVGTIAYDPTCFFGFVDNNDEPLEWVPIPVQGDGKEFIGGGGGYGILNGAQNRDAALHFLDFAIDAVGHTAMQMVAQGRADYGFKGMTGRTKDSADFLEWWENFIDGEYLRLEGSPYYDWDYYNACVEYWDKLPIRQGAWHGWRYSTFSVPTIDVFIDYPPSTAVSMYLEDLQTRIDEHNEYVLSLID